MKWVLSHLSAEGNGGADEMARLGSLKHMNNLPPLSMRHGVTEWDALRLELIAESEVQLVTSDVDSTDPIGGGS